MKNHNILVSILVPVYNTERYIEKCARSLFDQSYTNIEFIFINDSSPDKSINILTHLIEKEYTHLRSNIKIISHQKNKGLAAARNTAIEAANGDYIIHVDSDDYLEKNCIEKLVQEAKRSNADFIICDYWEILPDKSVYRYRNFKYKNQYLKSLIAFQTPPCIWGNLIRRELYIQNNIKTIEQINYAEDYTVISKLIYNASFISKVNQALYYYLGTNPNSYMNQPISQNQIKQTLIAFETVSNFFSHKKNYKIAITLGFIHIRNLYFSKYKTILHEKNEGNYIHSILRFDSFIKKCNIPILNKITNRIYKLINSYLSY